MTLSHAVKWSFFSELAAKIIQPIVFIILARLLSPEDFGVVAASLMVVGFSQIFWEAGMGKAIIQRQTDIGPAANAAFWINIGIGVTVAGVLLVSAEFIAHALFRDERVTLVLQVMSFQVLLGAVSSIHVALLQKEMDFKRLFWVRFSTISLPGIASIPLAWAGMGYWALVAGTIVGQIAQVVVLLRLSTWRPQWSFHIRIATEMWRFGSWVAAYGLLAWFYVWGDSLIVGAYLGSHELGIYRTGNQLALMIFTVLFGPIVPVLYSHLSTMNTNRARIAKAAEKVIKTLALVTIPIALMVYSLAIPIGEALFGAKWVGIGPVIGVMSLTHGLAWVSGMNGEIYRALGKPSYEAVVPAIAMSFYFAAYLISIQFGLETFLWTRLGLAAGALLLHLYFMKRLVSIPILPIIGYLIAITLTCGILLIAAQSAIADIVVGAWWQVAVGGSVNLVIVAGVIFLIGRNGVLNELLSLIRRREK